MADFQAAGDADDGDRGGGGVCGRRADGEDGAEVDDASARGDLALEWRKANECVSMTRPAVEVFSGEWEG